MSSEDQNDEETFRLREGTIVQNEQEIRGQRRLIDITWNPQLQLHFTVLPQNYASEEDDLYNQQRNLRVEQEESESAQIKEEQEELEPPQIKGEQEEQELSQIKEEKQEDSNPLLTKDEQVELCISQDLKQETETLMEIPAYEENGNNDLFNQQSFNVTDSLEEEENQHESTSSSDEETDLQNRDRRKRRDRSHVQSVANSHMSERQCDSDFRKRFRKAALVNTHKPSPNKKRLSSVDSSESSGTVSKLFVYRKNPSDYRLYTCTESGQSFSYRSDMRTDSGEKPFMCKECDKSFSRVSHLKIHTRSHTGEKPFLCNECDKSFSCVSNFKRHIITHTGEKPFLCKVCARGFCRVSHLKGHMRTHTGEKPFLCKKCDKSFSCVSNLYTHMRTHTGEKPFSCKQCNASFSQTCSLKRHMRTHTGLKPFLGKNCK
ncbi:zinc finger protein 436 [Oryzias melastigma]|uniref:zinc finger protein 436 n=1 Tax=Oryzias melastigma TaxID=30732 RepID=UPI000CF805FF|nr:zinc finger protein 436 [Oryzias melastigma]